MFCVRTELALENFQSLILCPNLFIMTTGECTNFANHNDDYVDVVIAIRNTENPSKFMHFFFYKFNQPKHFISGVIFTILSMFSSANKEKKNASLTRIIEIDGEKTHVILLVVIVLQQILVNYIH